MAESILSTITSLPANLVDRFNDSAHASTDCQTLKPSESLRYSFGPSAMTAMRMDVSVNPGSISLVSRFMSLLDTAGGCDSRGDGSGGSSARGITGSEHDVSNSKESNKSSDRGRAH